VSAKYLLPCPCGQQVVVDTRQAGQTILCSCGASLPAPTFLEMTALEPAPSQSVSEPAAATWNWQRRVRFLGTVLVLIAFAGGVWLYVRRPISRTIPPERIRQIAHSLPPSRTWDIWETMKQGLDRRTDQKYADAIERFHVWQVAVALVALAGVALIAVGTFGAREGGIGRAEGGRMKDEG
jgi:hypothetical protein